MSDVHDLIDDLEKKEAQHSILIRSHCNVVGCGNCCKKEKCDDKEVCESDKLQKAIWCLQDEIWLRS